MLGSLNVKSSDSQILKSSNPQILRSSTPQILKSLNAIIHVETLDQRSRSGPKARFRPRRLQRADQGRTDWRRHAHPRVDADDRVRDVARSDDRPRQPSWPPEGKAVA